MFINANINDFWKLSLFIYLYFIGKVNLDISVISSINLISKNQPSIIFSSRIISLACVIIMNK